MENKLKMRISSLFRSCKSKKINTDVFQQPAAYFYANHHQHRQLIEIFSPKHPPFASVNVEEEPESPESFPTHQSSCTAIRTKLCGGRWRDHHHLPQVTDVESQMCPHALPISTFTTQNFRANDKVKKSKRSKKVRSRSRISFGINYYEFPACNYNGLFSSDEDEEDDDDRTTFFSSKSLSSDSSDLLLRQNNDWRRRRSKKTANVKKKSDKRTCPLPEGFAVVKCSKDPYSDFMSSMIEMIAEKQIFAADELEKLLHRFLWLNSDHHHETIIQVFKDIWDALFTNY